MASEGSMNKQKRLLNTEGGGAGIGQGVVHIEPTMNKYFYLKQEVDK